MTTATITPEALMEKVLEIAARQPDRVYKKPRARDDFDYVDSCEYIHGATSPADIQPGCIFGHALVELGLDLEDFFRPDGVEFAGIVQLITFSISDKHPAFRSAGTTNPQYFNWVAQVQHAQDTRRSWGEAVKQADELYPGVRGVSNVG